MLKGSERLSLFEIHEAMAPLPSPFASVLSRVGSCGLEVDYHLAVALLARCTGTCLAHLTGLPGAAAAAALPFACAASISFAARASARSTSPPHPKFSRMDLRPPSDLVFL